MDELTAQARMAEILNDTPVEIVVAGERMPITAIKPGVAALIAEESVRIQKSEHGDMVDLMKRMAEVHPAVVRCITLAILNDRDRIFSDYKRKVYSEEYEAMYDKVMWESDHNEWIGVLLGVFRLLNLDFFFRTTEAIQNFRLMMLTKRTKEQS